MPNAIINVGQTGGQVNISTATAPATPAVGVVTLYAGTDKALHALNSDGTDITIAAAAAASPITVQQTCSLVSTGVGATAGTGQNCAIVIGNNACVPSNAGDSSIVIGKSARHTTFGGESIAIGSGAYVTNSNVVSIGCGAGGESQGGVNIGQGSCTVCNNGIGNIALGRTATAYGVLISSNPFADIAIGNGAVARGGDSLAMGQGTFACENKSISIGGLAKVFPGATGTIVLGASSVGGTGACNSVVIGNSARTTAACSIVMGQTSCAQKPAEIVIGNNIATPATSAQCSIYIGNCITPGGNCQGAGILGQVMVGFKVSQNQANENVGGSVLIGHCITNNHQNAVSSDGDTIVGICSTTACSRGNNAIFGRAHTAGGSSNTVIGYANSYTATDSLSHYYNVLVGAFNSLGASTLQSIVIGSNSNTVNDCTIAIGRCSCSTAAGAIAIGAGNVASNAGATVIGNGITSEKTNTVHVNSLIAYGQAASKTNAVGSTGGSVTLNWDNSNIQTLTLTSNITTLTKSNPIDGAVYTLFLTQGGSGGYTVDFGADVDWAGGTGPTLSTAIGATDAVSLVYIAGITGYYGNANLNFA